jgi:hypothetical protein
LSGDGNREYGIEYMTRSSMEISDILLKIAAAISSDYSRFHFGELPRCWNLKELNRQLDPIEVG